MFIIKWLFLIFLTFLIQTQINPYGKQLNISVVLVYFFILRTNIQQARIYRLSIVPEAKGLLFGASVGLVEDILTGSIIGPALFSKGLIGFLITIIFSDVVFKWTYLSGILVLILVTIMDGLLVSGIRTLFENLLINKEVFAKDIFFQTVINILFGIIIRPKNL